MTLETAKNKVKKSIRIQRAGELLGLHSNFNTPLCTFVNCMNKLVDADERSIFSKWYSHITQ